MDGLIELRCKYCGAPLDREEAESDAAYVTCSSCGTTPQRVDAKAYMDQMMGQIQNWISKAIPGGFSLAQQENVDPIARHNIYMNNVKPMIDLEIREFRFAMNTLMANPLIVLPFTKGEPARSKHTSTEAFEFNAKLKSIEPLAVDGSNKADITEAENLSSAYAMIINNSKLVSDTTPGRFALMSKNFKESADAVRKCKGYEPLAARLDALSEVCTASDLVLNGDALGCTVKAETAVEMLKAAKSEILKNPRLAMMIRAVDLEIAQSNTLKNTTDSVVQGESSDPLQTLETINKIASLDYPDVIGWNYLIGNQGRQSELQRYADEIMDAKNGGVLEICSGSGNTLYPFWDVDLRYSFTTGSLFKKKTVEVTEDILIPATFTICRAALENPRYGLTDIFALAPESSILDRIKGDEQSISGGVGIGRLTDSAAHNPVNGRKIVLPLSTKKEATKLVEEYLNQCASSHSKLRLSKPAVKRLVYIPCDMESYVPNLPKEFSGLVPGSVNADEMRNIVIM